MKHLLLIEDDVHLMKINEEFLSAFGYRITKAYCLREAEQALQEEVPDLIVMDVMLPDGDGMEFCEKLRRTLTVPMLFLTGKGTARDIVEGLHHGGDDYLTRPYDLEEFQARVEALLRRADMYKPSNRITVGILSFDRYASLAYANDEVLNLTKNEFGILLYLANHLGQVVSKEELHHAIWGQEVLANYTAVWSTVSRLKKKIAPYEDRVFIESNHDGYAFVLLK